MIAILIWQGMGGAANPTKSQIPAISPKQYQQDVITLVNERLRQAGLKPLVENKALERSASFKGQDMIKRNYAGHNGPGGTELWSFFEKAGVKFSRAGENLGEGFMSPEALVESWMNSPAHKANILSPDFTGMGVAVFYDTGKSTILGPLVVQHLASFIQTP